MRYSRFRFLKWSLSIFEESEEIRRADFPIPEEAKSRKFPIRALRYWWISCAVQEELQRRHSPPVIADVGCGGGMLKRFIPPIEGAHWIGLDFRYQKERMEIAKYDRFLECDFDRTLPLPDSAADIVICSHVLEHLPRPEFTAAELARILRPGGMLLIGVPVAPKIIARIREWQFQRQIRAGTRGRGHHINAFWPRRVERIVGQKGMVIDFMSGTYLLRKKGSFLEDHAWWIRVNQVWGALCPSLSQELCVQLRKPA